MRDETDGVEGRRAGRPPHLEGAAGWGPWSRRVLEEVAHRAEWLGDADRALIRAAFEEGTSPAELARLTGVSARSIRRRLKRLAERVRSPRFVFVGRRLLALPPTRRRVAAAVLLRGMSMRRAARELRLSVYAVRLHVLAVEAMYEAAARAA